MENFGKQLDIFRGTGIESEGVGYIIIYMELSEFSETREDHDPELHAFSGDGSPSRLHSIHPVVAAGSDDATWNGRTRSK
jgi:hypothetical protein